MTTTKTAMPTLLRVSDIMTSEVMTIDASSTVYDASQALTERKVGGAPVLKGQQLVGVVSKTDLTDTRKDLEVRVDKVMTPIVYAVRPHDPAFLAVQLMVDESIHRVVVVGNKGELEGIVTSHDVLRAIRNGRTVSPQAPLTLDYVDLRTLR